MLWERGLPAWTTLTHAPQAARLCPSATVSLRPGCVVPGLCSVSSMWPLGK